MNLSKIAGQAGFLGLVWGYIYLNYDAACLSVTIDTVALDVNQNQLNWSRYLIKLVYINKRMKKTFKYLLILSLILNVYYFSTWIYVYNLYDSQETRVENFQSFTPWMSLSIWNVLFIILTVTSIIIALKYRSFSKLVLIPYIIMQGAFLFLYVWQSL